MRIRLKNKNVFSIGKTMQSINIKIGGVNGENFMLHLHINVVKKYGEFSIHWNTDNLIKLFGYNQKTINLWRF